MCYRRVSRGYFINMSVKRGSLSVRVGSQPICVMIWFVGMAVISSMKGMFTFSTAGGNAHKYETSAASMAVKAQLESAFQG